MKHTAIFLALAFAGAAAHAQTHDGQLAEGDPQLAQGEYYDTYEIEAQPGQTIEADMTSSDFDTYLVLITPAGASEENDDFESSQQRSRLTLEAAEGGTYRVLATSYAGGATGRYRLDLRVGDVSGSAPATPEPTAGLGGAVAGHWVGGALAATQYQDRVTGAYAPTNGIGTTLDLAADGTYRQSRVMQQTTYGCTSVVNVDEQGTYTARDGQLILNRQSGRSWGQICGGSPYDRTLEVEADVFTYELGDDEAKLTRYKDGEYFDTLSRQ